MDDAQLTNRAFVEKLGSASPTPGGGGAAALVGAVGAALGEMVGALSEGKVGGISRGAGGTLSGGLSRGTKGALSEEKSGAETTEKRLGELRAGLQELAGEFLGLMQADAEGFRKLQAAYRARRAVNEEAALEVAKREAAVAPMKMMELAVGALELVSEVAEMGTKMMQSDAGCAAVALEAALVMASLNVGANARVMRDKRAAQKLAKDCRGLRERGEQLAQEIKQKVEVEVWQSGC